MWSVPKRFKSVYFPLFYVLGIIGIGCSVWYEAAHLGRVATQYDIANAVIVKVPAILLTAAFSSLVITEVSMVLAEMVGNYLKKRNARMEAAAIAKGRAEGRAEGAAGRDRAWEEWFQRYRSAQERGLSFDEPPPSSREQNGMNSSD